MKKLLVIVLILCVPFFCRAQWQPKISPIKTPWTDQVDRNNPLPEYPRPQFVRTEWKNLNGYWEFKSGAVGEAVPRNQTLGSQIVVPFAPEATLSGIVKHYDRVWYRKLITIPSNWSGKRILIHFGAIDWESEVYVNGSSLGIHKGGYDEITYDITDKLVGTGTQEIIVRVYDPTRDAGQPRGKQTTDPGGIMYTCVTGIWQTVWLEPVAAQNISEIKLIPEIDNNRLKITVNSAASALTFSATAKEGSKIVGSVSGNVNKELYIPISNARLWSPDDPFLYDLNIELKNGSTVVDVVSSYFGMRKIALVKESPTPKIYLNNKPVYMMGPLDQGYWPDGIYTAPTDEALRFDLEAEKKLGFNMVRKHIKVEPQRWYYWADKLGLLVWQDMPSPNSYDTPPNTPVDEPQFATELTRMIKTHLNSPSIVMWVLFNEWQAQHNTPAYTYLIKELDPNRLINQGSGHLREEAANDILDGHYYSPPQCPSSTRSAVVCGEYGGIGLAVQGHLWSDAGNPYGDVGTSEKLVSTYSGFSDKLLEFKSYNAMSGAVYTEITDVEREVNGFLTYDRLWKVDPNQVKAINEKIIRQTVSNRVDLIHPNQTWKYTTGAPGSSWNTAAFNDNTWASATGGFGTMKDDNGVQIGTLWNTNDIWTRLKFNVGNLTSAQLQSLTLSVFHDEACEIYINGVLAASLTGYNGSYEYFPISQAAKNAIVLNGTNTIAIHCHQTTGGQYIDATLFTQVLSEVAGPVTVYKDCSYGGTAIKLGAGEYTSAKLNLLGISDNDISSLRITKNFQVILYDGDNFTGTSKVLTADNACLVNELWPDNATNWNDKVSSLKIIVTGVASKSGYYTIQNRNSGLYLDVNGTSTTNGAAVLQRNANAAANQTFQLVEVSTGTYKILALHSNKALDVNTTGTAEGAAIQQWTYSGISGQHFTLVDAGNGYYKLVANSTGKIVEVAGASLADGARVQLWNDNAQTCGEWSFKPVTVTTAEDGLTAEYYNGMNFQEARFTRKDPNINFDWGMGSPDVLVNPDNYSVRWTGKLEANYSEEYTFYITSDNGRRLWVNNQLVIDKWIGDWDVEYSGKITLQAGQRYDIKVEYFEEVGGANIKLSWSSATQAKEIIPAKQFLANALPPVEGTGDGLSGNYFNGKNFETPVHSRKDATINFAWDAGSPNAAVAVDGFSARWTGQIQPKHSGEYTFYINSDNGRRLWINNQLVVDGWVDDWGTEYAGKIILSANQKYDIKLEYFENFGGASCKLEWSHASQTREVVPTKQLYSNTLPTVTITAPSSTLVFESPAGIVFNAAASDNGSVAKVEYYNGAIKIGQATTSPYSFTWSNVAAGTYAITAAATDNLGGVGVSAILSVKVNPGTNQLPSITLTAPTNGASYNAPASIAISANASDPDGTIAKVEFYNGAQKLGEDASSPYSYTWTNVATGSYTISAKAIDDKGASATSSNAAVTVKAVTDACASITAYVEGGGYVAGSKVKNGGRVYECKEWPYSGWCTGASWAYAPGTGAYWSDAWYDRASCTARAGLDDSPNGGAQEFSISPNPVKDELTISTTLSVASVMIMDLQGKVVYQSKAQYAIPTEELAPGMYTLILMTDDNQKLMKKFIKMK